MTLVAYARFELNAADVDGTGSTTPGVVFYVPDNGDDVFFNGAVDADHLLTKVLRVQDADKSAYVQFCAPGVMTGSYALCYPPTGAATTVGQALRVATIDTSGSLLELDLEWYTPADVGDITNVIAGTGLSGGGTSGAVTLNVEATQAGITTAANLTTVGVVGTGTWQAGTIGEGYGGTGQTTYAEGDILYGDDATGLLRLAAGTNTHVLTLASGVPTWAAPTTGDVESVNGTSTGGITATNGGGPAVTLALDWDTSAMSAGAITVANDSFAFLNATSGNVERETIADLMTAVAGSGITATSGVLSADTVAAAAGTLTGAALAGNVLTSSLTTVGTITSGSWAVSGASIGAQYGGLVILVTPLDRCFMRLMLPLYTS